MKHDPTRHRVRLLKGSILNCCLVDLHTRKSAICSGIERKAKLQKFFDYFVLERKSRTSSIRSMMETFFYSYV